MISHFSADIPRTTVEKYIHCFPSSIADVIQDFGCTSENARDILFAREISTLQNNNVILMKMLEKQQEQLAENNRLLTTIRNDMTSNPGSAKKAPPPPTRPKPQRLQGGGFEASASAPPPVPTATRPNTYSGALQQTTIQIKAPDGVMGNVTIAPPVPTNAKTGKIEPTITVRQRRIIVLQNPQTPYPPANDVRQHVNAAFASAQRPRLAFRIGEIENNPNTGALTLLLGEKHTTATVLTKHKPLLERGLINSGLRYHSIKQDIDFGWVVAHGVPLNQARGIPTGSTWSPDVWRNYDQW
jgi:hypothetical protein